MKGESEDKKLSSKMRKESTADQEPEYTIKSFKGIGAENNEEISPIPHDEHFKLDDDKLIEHSTNVVPSTEPKSSEIVDDKSSKHALSEISFFYNEDPVRRVICPKDYACMQCSKK